MRRIIAALAILLPIIFADTSQATPPGFAGTTNEVVLHCTPNANAQVDPIKDYGVAQTGHLHTPAGANAFSSTMVVSDMAAASTSCLVKSDHTTFWMPTLCKSVANGGSTTTCVPATIRSMDYYLMNQGYTIPSDPASVAVYDPGLRFVRGDSTCTTVSCGIGAWQCSGTTNTIHTIPTSCGVGVGPEVSIYNLIQCWDGASLGQGMGGSGAAVVPGVNTIDGTTTDNIHYTCPSGYTTIPATAAQIHYGPDALGGWLSSDVPLGTQTSCPGCSAHFDLAFGQSTNSFGAQMLPLVINGCLNLAGLPVGVVTSCTEKPFNTPGATLYGRDPTGHYTTLVTN